MIYMNVIFSGYRSWNLQNFWDLWVDLFIGFNKCTSVYLLFLFYFILFPLWKSNFKYARFIWFSTGPWYYIWFTFRFNVLWFDCFLKDFIYLFERETEIVTEIAKESTREEEREKQTPCSAGSPMQGSISGPWDHDLSWRQMLKWLSHPAIPIYLIVVNFILAFNSCFLIPTSKTSFILAVLTNIF